jgi:putative PIN family toxin of toxin-antitoxin system
LIVVVDSGVWISALQFEGTPLLVIERILGRHALAFCGPIALEIRTGLINKFGWTHEEVDEAFGFYFSRAIKAEVPGDLRGVCRDPNDDMVLECAALANADVIVSGDKDLLAVGEYEGIRILTPRAFLDEFSRPAEA